MFIEKDNALVAEFLFPDFRRAFAFMTEVAVVAEQLHHHPEWSNVWNKVAVKLTTHDSGNTVTALDRKLAAACEEIYLRHSS